MTKLCQIVAVDTGVKNKTYAHLTGLYKQIQKDGMVTGLTRTYLPRDEEGEELPPESTRVQLKIEDVIKDIIRSLTRLFDVQATKDYANCEARADVIIDGELLVRQAPPTFLLFLEKQLSDLRAVITKLPAHDQSQQWEMDQTTGWWRTAPAITHRTKKVPRNHVKAAATDKHPAQVDVYFEDVTVGSWARINYSGALPPARIAELLDRVDRLQIAVKQAREEANSMEVRDIEVGNAFLGWLFR